MATKLWDKGQQTDKMLETFTIGRDQEMDLFLAPFDVLGTLAHIRMLTEIGLLNSGELSLLQAELKTIYEDILKGGFRIEEGVEDIHSQVEVLLTRKLGDVGKKVHSGRSRNDQVLVDIKLFLRQEIREMAVLSHRLFQALLEQSEAHKQVLMPGYTHLQVAMPSSFGLWFGAYAESLSDDMLLLQASWEMANQNPLGSAAGYGSSFPLNRTLTTRLLGFNDLNYNVVYAQMGRGKTEKTLSFAMSSVAATLSRFCTDACLFMSQNFGFITLPEELTTGSSIMPHKKNPDVFELTRARCNKIQSLPNEITLLLANLPSGYFRDMQILKECLFPALGELKSCLEMLIFMVPRMGINTHILDDPRYQHLFSVENLNERVLQGVPFRDAYQQVGQEIRTGTFKPRTEVHHTHEGSIGNLCNQEIARKMGQTMARFSFEKVDQALTALTRLGNND
jgi:argininosuccinate lyase